jgi:hypothetical protein
VTHKVIGCILLLNFIWSPGKAQDEKGSAIQKYKSEYLASEVKDGKEIKWRGNVNKCDEGSTSDKIRNKALLRINYFRTLSGLRPVKFKDEYNALAQKAAFITHVNNKIDHNPDLSSKCYSEESVIATSNSSLGFMDFVYHPELAFITEFVKDYGEFNKAVGHRRAMLYSRSVNKGYGTTLRAEAIYSDYTSWLEKDSILFPKYFSYPVGGYNEIDLVFPRWSFSIPDLYKVDFKGAVVELKDETGRVINVKVLPYEDIYDPTLVWELKDKLKRDYFLNHSVIVNIKNVRVNESLRSYSYRVRFFDYAGE